MQQCCRLFITINSWSHCYLRFKRRTIQQRYGHKDATHMSLWKRACKTQDSCRQVGTSLRPRIYQLVLTENTHHRGKFQPPVYFIWMCLTSTQEGSRSVMVPFLNQSTSLCTFNFCTSGNFLKPWQHLICPNLLHSQAIFVKSIIFLVKSFLGNFCRLLTIFIWSRCSFLTRVSLQSPNDH